MKLNILSTMQQTTDWHEKVYQSVQDPLCEDWDLLCEIVKERDHYKCTNCKCRIRKELTVHHIVPRKDGGTNKLHNLTTLCRRCHDMEEIGLDYVFNKQKPVSVNDWHTWVYGGAKNPGL